MEFIKGYMDNMQYRHALNDLTQEIFGFTFEDWYTAGYFEGEYIPYSYIENGQIISNASANIMKMMQNGKKKLYIQIGTVATRPEFRHSGLASELIRKIISEYEPHVDGFYLFANVSALDFYEKLGFNRLDQWRYCSNIKPTYKVIDPFQKAGEELLGRYRHMLQNGVIMTRFDQQNRVSLQLFYTGNMEDVYYHSKLDCFAVMHMEDRVLHLDSIISSKKISMSDILQHISQQYDTLVLGFTPDKEDADCCIVQPYDGEDDYRLFYMGSSLEEISTEKLYFPVMSHA